MKVSIELRANGLFGRPTKQDMQKNIDALQRAIDRKPQCNDDVLLLDTKSILEGLQKELP